MTVVPFFVCGVLKLRILLFVRLGGECLMLVSARIAVRKQCWEVRRELTVRLRPTSGAGSDVMVDIFFFVCGVFKVRILCVVHLGN